MTHNKICIMEVGDQLRKQLLPFDQICLPMVRLKFSLEDN